MKYAIADNRKLIIMERLRDPFKDPEIAVALRIAKSIPGI
jgi:hypothetical protein